MTDCLGEDENVYLTAGSKERARQREVAVLFSCKTKPPSKNEVIFSASSLVG